MIVAVPCSSVSAQPAVFTKRSGLGSNRDSLPVPSRSEVRDALSIRLPLAEGRRSDLVEVLQARSLGL